MIEAAWREAGRSGNQALGRSKIYLRFGPNAAVHANANYGDNPELAAKRLRTLPVSSTAVKDAIKRQADLGVDEFILRPCAEDLDQMDLLAEIAAEVR
jgi:hypothetical protein